MSLKELASALGLDYERVRSTLFRVLAGTQPCPDDWVEPAVNAFARRIAVDPVALSLYLTGASSPAPNATAGEWAETEPLDPAELLPFFPGSKSSRRCPVATVSVSQLLPPHLLPDRPRERFFAAALATAEQRVPVAERPAIKEAIDAAREVAKRRHAAMMPDEPRDGIPHHIVARAGVDDLLNRRRPFYAGFADDEFAEALEFLSVDLLSPPQAALSAVDWLDCPIPGLLDAMQHYHALEQFDDEFEWLLVRAATGWTIARADHAMAGSLGGELSNLMVQTSAHCLAAGLPAETQAWLTREFQPIVAGRDSRCRMIKAMHMSMAATSG